MESDSNILEIWISLKIYQNRRIKNKIKKFVVPRASRAATISIIFF